jgi:hypothetical protein
VVGGDQLGHAPQVGGGGMDEFEIAIGEAGQEQCFRV